MLVEKLVPIPENRAALAETALLLVMVTWLDRLTGWEFSTGIFYGLVVLRVAWKCDRRAAVIFALISALLWFWANYPSNPYSTPAGYEWAAFNRLFFFLCIAIGGSALRQRQESDRARIAALERARDLEREITLTSERQQRRIGQDLHDGICQMLAAAHYALTSSRDALQVQGVSGLEGLDDAARVLKDAMIEARSIARHIYPFHLESVGLEGMLEELAESTRRIRHVDVSVDSGDVGRVNDPDQAMHLYRIAQEAINNALRHGEATAITIRLSEWEGTAMLSISDNGKGLPAGHDKGDGMGLRTMQHRARLLGGNLTIEGGPGTGTTVVCHLPPSANFPPSTAPPPHAQP